MIGDDVDVLWRLRLATVLAFKVVGFCGFLDVLLLMGHFLLLVVVDHWGRFIGKWV